MEYRELSKQLCAVFNLKGITSCGLSICRSNNRIIIVSYSYFLCGIIPYGWKEYRCYNITAIYRVNLDMDFWHIQQKKNPIFESRKKLFKFNS